MKNLNCRTVYKSSGRKRFSRYRTLSVNTYSLEFQKLLLLKTSCEKPYLEVVHPVWKRHNEAWIVVNGFVTEDDIDAMVQVSEVIFRSQQITCIILGVIPGKRSTDSVTGGRAPRQHDRRETGQHSLLKHYYIPIHELIQSLVQGDVVVLNPLR